MLAAAIRRAKPDLVVTATESTDGYTGTLPVQVAELLGLPSVTFAKAIAVDGNREGGAPDRGRLRRGGLPLPAVVTVTAGVVEPRYPSFKGIMAAKSKPVDNLTVADLGHRRRRRWARPAAGQEITDVSEAEARGGGEIVVDEGDGAQRIVAFLEQLKVI